MHRHKHIWILRYFYAKDEQMRILGLCNYLSVELEYTNFDFCSEKEQARVAIITAAWKLTWKTIEVLQENIYFRNQLQNRKL